MQVAPAKALLIIRGGAATLDGGEADLDFFVGCKGLAGH